MIYKKLPFYKYPKHFGKCKPEERLITRRIITNNNQLALYRHDLWAAADHYRASVSFGCTINCVLIAIAIFASQLEFFLNGISFLFFLILILHACYIKIQLQTVATQQLLYYYCCFFLPVLTYSTLSHDQAQIQDLCAA